MTDRCDRPLSFYAATKRANELMAHAYTHLYGIPTSGLRFFTVYGPWGRPDMAVSLCAGDRGRSDQMYNYGRLRRDFTYVDDATEAVARLLAKAPKPDPAWSEDGSDMSRSAAPWRVYNIGNGNPVELTEMVRLIEQAVGRPAAREFLPMQPGDVLETFADRADLDEAIGSWPQTGLGEGIRKFVDWFGAYRSQAAAL